MTIFRLSTLLLAALLTQSCGQDNDHVSNKNSLTTLSEQYRFRLIQHVNREIYSSQNPRHRNDRMLVSSIIDGNVIFVYFISAGRCGTGGCTMAAIRIGANGWETIGLTSRVQLPIRLVEERQFGYSSVEVSVFGGSTMPPQRRILRYNGIHYPRFADDSSTLLSNGNHSGMLILSDTFGEVIYLNPT